MKILLAFCKLWKNVLSYRVERILQKFLVPDPVADDFQNSLSSSLYMDRSLYIFMKIQSVVYTWSC